MQNVYVVLMVELLLLLFYKNELTVMSTTNWDTRLGCPLTSVQYSENTFRT